MKNFAVKFLYFQNQFKILHWSTTSYSRHMAYGQIYDDLEDLIDSFVEIYQGKNKRLEYSDEDVITFKDVKNIGIENFLKEFKEFLLTEIPSILDESTDTDLLNLRDEILGLLNKLRYLLSLN